MSDVVDLEWFRAEQARERKVEQRAGEFYRRDQRAKQAGWRSYRQMREWLPRFGVRAGTVDTEQQWRKARELAAVVCPDNHRQARREGRGGSLFCTACDVTVNGDGQRYARGVGGEGPGRPGDPDLERRGDWRARLVQAYLAAR